MSYSPGFKLLLIYLLCLSGWLQAQHLVKSQKTSDEISRINALHEFAERNSESNTMVALDFVKTALDASQKSNYEYGIARSYFLLGKIYGTEIQNFSLGIENFNKSIQLAQRLDSLELLSNGYFYAGKLNYDFEEPTTALHQFQNSLKLFRKKHDSLNESIAQIYMASIYSELGGVPYDTVIAYFQQSLKKAAELKSDYLRIYTLDHYTTSLITHNDFKEAEKYLDQGLQLAENEESFKGLSYRLYANMGKALLKHGETEKAIGYFEKSKSLCTSSKIKKGYGEACLGLAEVYATTGDKSKEQAYYDDALTAFTSLRLKSKIADTYGQMARSAEAAGRFEKACEYKSKQMAYSDSVSHAQQQHLVQEITSNLMQRSGTDIVALQRKDAHINGLYIALLAVVIITLSFIALLYFNQRQLLTAKERSQLLNEKVLLQKQLETQQLEDEQLKHKLEYNAKILTANTLNLIQKNEILEKIKKRAEEVRKANSAELPSRIAGLMQTVNFALNVDKDWENFSIHFEQVHNDFFNQLKAKFPSLNSNDLKLCALLKLNLDTKQIATVMDISPESVKVARSRLRKKLQLDQSENLSSFITYI